MESSLIPWIIVSVIGSLFLILLFLYFFSKFIIPFREYRSILKKLMRNINLKIAKGDSLNEKQKELAQEIKEELSKKFWNTEYLREEFKIFHAYIDLFGSTEILDKLIGKK